MKPIVQNILILPIRLYQIVISPILQSTFGMKCRYEPSCSYYMIGAIREWGVFKGMYLGIKRLLRCGPWGGHGYDPVPENPKNRNKC
ncbi:MAG: membrane protein insertion efficiency factor YidD [Saprospiraceae bacterium]